MTRFPSHLPTLPSLVAGIALLVALVPGAATGAQIVFNESCFPTCDPRDGRLLIMAGGPGLETRSDTPINLKFHIESTVSTFTIEIFDGDTVGCEGGGPCDPAAGVGKPHWDIGQPVPLFFTLYALQEQPDGTSVSTLVDPSKIVLGGGSVASTNPFSGTDMYDNAWFPVTVTVGSEAQAPRSGDYRYQLKLELDPSFVYGPRQGTLNGLKVRSTASLLMSRVEQPFAFEAKWTNLHDLKLIYPNFDLADPFNPANTAGSTYDGSFTFYFHVPPSSDGTPHSELSVYDADLDHGNWNGTIIDTDDPDTSGYAVDLPFPTGDEVHAEGESGAFPFDDKSPSGLGLYLVRTPNGVYNPLAPVDSAVTYRLSFPANGNPGAITCRAPDAAPGPVIDGRASVLNQNPSGNREWEKFTLSTATFNPSTMDCRVDSIPSGVYRVDLVGMDMNNLNAWFFGGDVCGVRPDGKPDCPSGVLKLGDTVWLDSDADGILDGAESGIQGVIVHLEDAAGNVLARALTDASGQYGFDVFPGPYRVRVATESLFGGDVGGAVGDRVWLDIDADGNQDSNEPGLDGIEVLLFDAGPDGVIGGGDDLLVDSTLTADDGRYRFAGLPSGSYYTTIADASEPEGLTLSGGSDPSAVRTITGTEVYTDLDFGFTNADVDTALVGDFVWHDLDGDGVQDAGEPGIDGVVVSLLDDTGAVVAKTVTSGGHYLFTGVAPGVYQVDVSDELGVLADYSLTTFNDPTPLFLVAAGDTLLDKDFGYDNDTLFSVTDVVWLDADRDGVADADETRLSGVTVALVGPGGTVLATTTTATDGSFTFAGLPDGAYSLLITDYSGLLNGLLPTTDGALVGSHGVSVNGANVSGVSFGYVSGGALADLRSTTGGEVVFDSVVDYNVLTYDFGYAPLGASCAVGRPTELVFEYVGDSCSSPNADNNSQTQDSCTGPLDGDEPVQMVITRKANRFVVTPSTETIEVGDLFTIGAANPGELMWPNTDLSIRQGGVELQRVVLHTSCSEPLDPGDQFGSIVLRSYIHP